MGKGMKAVMEGGVDGKDEKKGAKKAVMEEGKYKCWKVGEIGRREGREGERPCHRVTVSMEGQNF